MAVGAVVAVGAHVTVDPTTDEAVVKALADKSEAPFGIVACDDEAAGAASIIDCADVIIDCVGPLVICTAAANVLASSDVVVVVVVVIFGLRVDIARGSAE